MKIVAVSLVAAALLAGPCLAQSAAGAKAPGAKPVPTDPKGKAVSCSANLAAFAVSIGGKGELADELNGFAARWKTQAHTLYEADGQTAADADAAITALMAEINTGGGLPGGTTTIANWCEAQAAKLPS